MCKVKLFRPNVATLTLAACLLAGCTKTVITSESPDRSATVRVKEFCGISDCVVTVTVQKGWSTEKSIISRRDCIVNFAHVGWSPDASAAGIFVDNGYCSSIHEGYDLRSSSLVPFAPLAERVRQSIILEYGLRPVDLIPYNGDALKWAHYPGDGIAHPGPTAFRKKYQP